MSSSYNTYIFKCYRNTTCVNAENEEKALTKLYLSLTKKLKDVGRGFSNKKCFGATLYQRTERFMVLDGELNLSVPKQLDIIESPDFLSIERLKILVSKGIIRMKIMEEDECFNHLEPDYPSCSDDEKYTSW
jgi:hypothetical protein